MEGFNCKIHRPSGIPGGLTAVDADFAYHDQTKPQHPSSASHARGSTRGGLNFNRLRPPPRQAGQASAPPVFSARQAHAALRGPVYGVGHGVAQTGMSF